MASSLHDEVTKMLGMSKTASINAPAVADVQDVPDFEKLASALENMATQLAPQPTGRLSAALQKMAGNVPEGQPAQNTLDNNLATPPGGGKEQVKAVQQGVKEIPNVPGSESFLTSPKNLVKTNIDEVPQGTQPTITAGGGNIVKSATIVDRYRQALQKHANEQVYGKQGYSATNVDEHVLPRKGEGAEAARHLASNAAAMNVPQTADKPMFTQAAKILPKPVAEMDKDKNKVLHENLSAADIAKSRASMPKLASPAAIAAQRTILAKLAESEEGKKALAELVKKKAEDETPADKIKKEVADKKKEAGEEKTASVLNLFEMGDELQ